MDGKEGTFSFLENIIGIPIIQFAIITIVAGIAFTIIYKLINIFLLKKSK